MIVLTGESLANADLERLTLERDCVVAIGAGEVRGRAAAALLFADWAILRPDAILSLEDAVTWAAAAWRIGRGAYALHLDGRTRLDAHEARARGLCDDVTEASLDEWLAGRSELALTAGASLIRQRGGDALERAEFARLFATGAPQRGLLAFLSRRR